MKKTSILIAFIAIFSLISLAQKDTKDIKKDTIDKIYSLEDVATTPLIKNITPNINFMFTDGSGSKTPNTEDTEMLRRANILINDLITPIGQTVCTVAFGTDIEDIPIFVQGNDDDKFSGNYLGLRGPDTSLIATIEVNNLAQKNDTKSKGFIFSATKAYSFIDNGNSIDCAFKISFIDIRGIPVAELISQNNDGINEMRIISGYFNSKTVKSITINDNSHIHRSGFMKKISETPQYCELNGAPLTILFYNGKVSVNAGGKTTEMSIAVGDYTQIDKIIFKVGDEANTNSSRSCLVLLDPAYDHV